jgi:UDP-N-acetylmuramoyl-tripeptide--D-alanyl-D-alanine ligase
LVKLTAAEVASLTGGKLTSGSEEASVQSISIDSRTIEPGDLFFAIIGPRFDGHRFVDQALERGAVGAVVSRPPQPTGKDAGVLILVDDTTIALQRLAMGVRRSAPLKVVGITGSVGKTTAKEATAAALSVRFKVLKSEGNLNNLYGLPLSILRWEDEDVAVLEMGMSAPGEIARLTEIAAPDVGVVLSVAEVHLEFFASLKAIAGAKGELFAGLGPGATAVVNADDPLVLEQAKRFAGQQVRFGIEEEANLRAKEIESTSHGLRFIVEADGEGAEVESPLHGVHNVYNLLAALAVARTLGVQLTAAARGLRDLHAAPHRGERIRFPDGPLVIDETYNSNPTAVRAALASLSHDDAKRRIAVLGDMLELGERAEALHLDCGREVAQSNVSLLVGVGSLGALIVEGARRAGMPEGALVVARDAGEAGEILVQRLGPGDVVLLKASRGVALEGALSVVRRRFRGQVDQ